MTIATDLRAMREYIAKHGFSPQMGRHGCARCFVGAAVSTIQNVTAAANYLFSDFQIDVDPGQLRRDGWGKRDALALLDIAGDCAEAEGK